MVLCGTRPALLSHALRCNQLPERHPVKQEQAECSAYQGSLGTLQGPSLDPIDVIVCDAHIEWIPSRWRSLAGEGGSGCRELCCVAHDSTDAKAFFTTTA